MLACAAGAGGRYDARASGSYAGGPGERCVRASYPEGAFAIAGDGVIACGRGSRGAVVLRCETGPSGGRVRGITDAGGGVTE